MAIDITPEQRSVGKENFHRVVGKLAEEKPGVSRRDFMKGLIAAGVVVPVGAAAYFGYADRNGQPAVLDRPVKAALIGTGDEGGVLVGFHNPEYLDFVAVCDIRPSNQKRIFDGDEVPHPRIPGKMIMKPGSPRRGFKRIPQYGKEPLDKIKVYDDYRKMLEDRKDIEAVVIALPLHLHAPVSIACMNAGKHVLCEKLMAWNIRQCKDMIKVAESQDRILSIGHQRHYSLLYAHAVEVLKSGILGDINHIRAQWHRNNTQIKKEGGRVATSKTQKDRPVYEGGWRPNIPEEDRKELAKRIRDLGYKDMEELVRWRLFDRTGGGLMAELGSHQLDACSIFLSALAGKKDKDGNDVKVRPLAVTAVGGKYFYNDDSEVEDHVFCTYEFPGKNYDPEVKPYKKNGKPNFNDRVAVTYSSISTNAFEPYGECIMGSKGTLVVQLEKEVMLWGGANRSTAVTVSDAGGGKPALEASSSTDPGERRAALAGQTALGMAELSRGYREEMEHFAYIIRMRDQGMESDKKKLKPRCDGRAAMADAIIALTANEAMKNQKRIEFQDEWFDPASDEVPDPDRVPREV
jgi:predicted dehydrogenase